MNKKLAALLFGIAFTIVGGGMDAFFLYKYFTNDLAMGSNPNAGIATLIVGLIVGTVPLAAGIYAIVRSLKMP